MIIISSTKPFEKSVLKREIFNGAHQCRFEVVTQQNIFSNNSDDTASPRDCSLRKLFLLSPRKEKSPFSCIPIVAFLQQQHTACLCSIQHSHDPTSLILFLSQHSHVLCFHCWLLQSENLFVFILITFYSVNICLSQQALLDLFLSTNDWCSIHHSSFCFLFSRQFSC